MSITYLQAFSTVVSLATMRLEIKQRPLAWPVTIVMTLFNTCLYYRDGIYHSCISNCICVVIAAYGWYQWCYGGKEGKPLLLISKTSGKGYGLICLGMALIVSCAYPTLLHLGAKIPAWGALTVALQLTGMWLAAGKRIETYLVWILYNILAIRNHLAVGYGFFTLKYLVYLFNSIYGFKTWLRQYRAQQQQAVDGFTA